MRHLRYFESKEELTLDEVDIEWARSHFDRETFGDFESHLDPDRTSIDFDISKSLKLNGEIVGCYCLSKFSIIECLSRVESWMEGDESEKLYKDLQFFMPKKEIRKVFKNKVGIFGDYLYIDTPYRNKNYAQILIDYAKTLGDYNWGITARGKPEKFWIEKQKRTRVYEYSDILTGKVNIVDSTIPF